MRPIRSATSDAASAPKKQRKVMTLQEKAELLDMYQILKSAAMVACHFKINDSSIRTIGGKKEFHEIVTTATPAGEKTLHFSQNTFFSY